MERFAPEPSIVVRDVILGCPFSAWPHRVDADDRH
ncbi:hypothetical protein FHR37_005570 [Actinopolymorpha cephalotaxi]|uniref:Uncharacterized protein n=1 Tax=Actinopolymorpha cephalotaxi TaxID=504797 RepID=A0ABX2SBX3_9ACTN|nr:hypothetical protein [Actinopolymorpha cephalotaxi]